MLGGGDREPVPTNIWGEPVPINIWGELVPTNIWERVADLVNGNMFTHNC